MTKFRDTDAALAFIASGPSRETSPRIMEAIAFWAGDLAAAETIWQEGLTNWDEDSKLGFIGSVTGDGQWGEPGDFCWGAQGGSWAREDS